MNCKYKAIADLHYLTGFQLRIPLKRNDDPHEGTQQFKQDSTTQ